jgi:hypothetical protein
MHDEDIRFLLVFRCVTNEAPLGKIPSNIRKRN